MWNSADAILFSFSPNARITYSIMEDNKQKERINHERICRWIQIGFGGAYG